MVAATKNKRGRPADKSYKTAVELNISNHAYSPEISTRAIQNQVNAEEFLCALIKADSRLYWFFEGRDGQIKHKGVAEQIGRMMRAGLVTEKQAMQIAENAVHAYANGMSSKEIEKYLRQYRISQKQKRVRNNTAEV